MPFVSMPNHYNLLNREEEREMLPLCAHLGVGVIPGVPSPEKGLPVTGTRRLPEARQTSSAAILTDPDGATEVIG
jgi:aryl-alcohol dehydrogenase-like predicted oxidoreductase